MNEKKQNIEVLLDLSKDAHVRKYIDHLSHIQLNGPIGSFSKEEIEDGIKFLISKTDTSWGLVNRRSQQIAVPTYGTERFYLNIGDVALLGICLRILENKEGFDRVLQKLNSRSRERLHVVPEVLGAASYARRGYEVRLEPELDNDKPIPDFAVLLCSGWIYFECKMVDSVHSISFQQYIERAGKFGRMILYALEDILDNNEVRVEIELRKRFTEAELRNHILIEVLTTLRDSLTGETFKKAVCHQDEYSVYVNDMRDPVSAKPEKIHIAIGIENVETRTSLSCQDARVVICLDPFGSQERIRISRLLKEARKQIPSGELGQIILLTRETLPDDFFKRKFANSPWENIVCVLNIGHYGDPRLTLNEAHGDFDKDFLLIPLDLIGTSVQVLLAFI